MDWDPSATDSHGYICPPCPVFHPTADEFKHPLKYISSIRHIGIQAGICKIVPPQGWRPPFAINEKKFRFRTRVQQLNCIEGHSRAEGNFVEALRLFLYRHGQPMKELPRADGQLVNLHLLYKAVVALGGYNAVCASDRWEQVVRRVGRTKAATEPSKELCQTYRAHYESCLLAYEQAQREKSISTPEEKKKPGDVQATPASASTSGDIKATPSSKARSVGKKRSGSAVDEDDSEVKEEEGMRVKRTLFSDGGHTSGEENEVQPSPKRPGKRPKEETRKLRQRDLEPEALMPSPTRNKRLGPPEINAGQKFYRFFPETGAVLAEVKRVFGGKRPHIAVRYIDDGSNDDVELATMEILIANGWDAQAAELAYNSEICQACLRGDCSDRMLLCDGCNSGQHLFCLDKPLDEVPSGDWYCQECVDDASDPEKGKASAKFGFDMGAEISMADYKERADEWKRNYFALGPDVNPDAAITDQELESEYWRLLSIPVHEQRLEVQYGSDVDTGVNGSGFPRMDLFERSRRCANKRWINLTTKEKSEYVRQLSEFFSHGLREGLSTAAGGKNPALDAPRSLEELLSRYAEDDWNLNNMPKLPGSVLQYLDEDIKGVMVPWLYAGMCFSTFCWHVEDHNFYSTSYVHCGAPKTWYGIPSASAELFEKTMKELTPELFGSQPDLHMQLVTMFSPKTLREHGVPVYRATCRPNEFVVTFPSAYHAGFNNGFNCAEAVNFATLDWLPWGAKSLRKYREFHKLPVFCHEALVSTLVETLVDGSSFDFELTESYLLPAVQQLLADYREFERRVNDSNGDLKIDKRELMGDFDKRQHRGALSGDADAEPSTVGSRRSMAARTCTKQSGMKRSGGSRAGKMNARTTKMSKMEAATPSTRPSRMVLWAGRSGKNEGLRCVTCKQYCYLQAVVCTKCRPPHGSVGAPTVGCVEHYSTMCKCINADHLVYLYRYHAQHLEDMVASLRSRLEGVRSWNSEVDAVLSTPHTLQVATKPTVQELKRLLSTGKAYGGASSSRLCSLEMMVAGAEHWSSRADKFLRTVRQQTVGLCLSVDDFECLLSDAEKLVVVPAAIVEIRDLVDEWRAARAEALDALDAVTMIQHDEATDKPTASSVPLRSNNARYSQLRDAITAVAKRLRAKKESTCYGTLLDQLAHADHYLNVVHRVNGMVATVVDKVEGSVDAVLHQEDVEHALAQADALTQSSSSVIASTETLRKALNVTLLEASEIDAALDDRSKSTEELGLLLRRAKGLPILPSRTRELEDRHRKSRSWEERAQRYLNGIPGTVSAGVEDRPSLAEVDEFYAQADGHFVSTSSLLRRQVHSRLQDCRRWYDAVHGLFLRPSNSQLPLAHFLQSALDKTQSTRPPGAGAHVDELPHSQLHCVCQQVLSERAQLITCQRCQRYFHPQCVRELLPQRVRDAFICASCSPPKRLKAGRSTEDLQPFCLCRGGEQAPMICCDFCDEWYHGACVELTPFDLDHVEVFRCPRCSRRQGLYYLDKKLLRREGFGRRPALPRVESFVAQLQSQLIATPPGAHELVAYVSAVKREQDEVDAFVGNFALQEFSAAAFAAPDYGKTQEFTVVELMERVTALEIGLDKAQADLAAVHWCVRACQLVLCKRERPPKYVHLVALLQDVKSLEPSFAFPREEYRLMQMTIAERVEKAAVWLHAAKTLEVEEWNVEKARRLVLEYGELGAYLELPVSEVQLVQDVAASRVNEADEEKEEGAPYEQQPDSAMACKKQRLW